MAKPRDYSVTFSGAGSRQLPALGRFIRVLDTPTAPVFFSLDDAQEVERGAGQAITDSDPKGFNKLVVRSTVAQTVKFTVADVPQDDSRTDVALTVSATVSGSSVLAAAPLVEVPALTSQKIADGNPDRIELRVALGSLEESHVWLGESGVGDEEGGLLEQGTVDYLATTAEVYAYNPHATESVFVSVLELEAP